MSRLYNMLSSARRRSSGTDEYWDQVVLQVHADTVTGEVGGDPFYGNVVLHMPMDGADNSTSFTDLKGKAIAVNGQSKMVTATKYFGTSSAYFDGTGDYLQPAAGSDFNFGTENFCLEAWVYPTRTGVQQPIFSFFTENTGRANFELNNGNRFQVEMYGVGVLLYNTTPISANTWYHVAFTRNGNTWKIFVDGSDTGTSYVSSHNLSRNDLVIGGGSYVSSMTKFFQGYIDDVIVYKGISKYTSNFTKPVSANPTFGLTYSDAKGHSIFGGGNTVLSTTQKKFGSKSLYLDGTGDYLQLDGSNDFVFATGDFTVEMWVFPTRLTGVQILYDSRTAEGVYPCIYLNGVGLAYWVSSAERISGTTPLTISAWHHVALSRSNGSTRLFLNGIQQGSTYADTNNYLNGASRPYIGASYSVNYGFQGYIDDIRVTKGVGRYTALFSNSSDPYFQYSTFLVNFESEYPTADQYASDVVLHLPMESTNDNTVFVDLKGNTITRNGNVYQSMVRYKYRKSSAYFDGNGDYLVTPSMWNLDTALYTIEFWVNYAGTKDGRALMFGTNSQATGYQVTFNTNGSMYAAVPNGGPREAYTAAGVITANTWHHIAVVLMASPRTLIFVDGVKKADNSTAGTLNLPDTMTLTIGCDPSYSQTTLAFEGYIEDLRITKNVNRYTADFSPPTSPLLSVPYIKDTVKDRPLSVVGNATLSSTEKKFGSYSAYFGGNGDYLQYPASADFSMGTGDFTVEGWVWTDPAIAPWARFVENELYNVTGGWHFSYNGSDSSGFRRLGVQLGLNGGGGARVESIYPIPTSQWVYVTICKKGGILSLYIDGIKQGALSTSDNFSSQKLRIGATLSTPGNYFMGYMDDLRITKGIDRYTDTFAVNSDQYYSNVVLHMPMEGTNASTSFTDLKGKTITVAGSTNMVTATKKFGTSSAYFDGSGDYLSVTDSADFSLGAGDFTIEMWVNVTAAGAYDTLIGQMATTANLWKLDLGASGLRPRFTTTSSSVVVGEYTCSTDVLTPATWHHLVVSRVGSNVYIFVDGVLAATTVYTVIGTLPDVASALVVGYDPLNAGRDFNGYIDDLRITKGVGRYTDSFAQNPDTNWSSVVLYMPMEGANTSTGFSDLKGKAVTVAGNTNTVTATKKFGTSSAYFDGTGDYLSLASSADFGMSTGSWTVEAWVYSTAAAWSTHPSTIVDFRAASSDGGVQLYVQTDGTLSTWNDSVADSSSISLSLNTWHHVAAVYDGVNLRLFVDGVSNTPNSRSYNMGSSKPCYIGSSIPSINPNNTWKGYIDDLRITKGVARYTANFTPPTAAHPVPNFTVPTAAHPVPNFTVPTATHPMPDFPYGSFTQAAPDSGQLVDPYWSNVVLGLHMDGLNAGTVFHDEKGKTVTPNGNVNTVTATKKFGNSSAYFDGSGDYLALPTSNNDFAFPGDFTIECWIYPTSVASYKVIYGAESSRFAFYINGSTLETGIWGVTGISYSAANSVTANGWQHVAVSRVGSSYKTFINGVEKTSDTYATSIVMPVSPKIGISAGTTEYFAGYIDDFRITKGVGRYTATFTPPTRAFPRS